MPCTLSVVSLVIDYAGVILSRCSLLEDVCMVFVERHNAHLRITSLNMWCHKYKVSPGNRISFSL